MSNYVLLHYGVKGQKWGVIRSKNRKSSKDSDSRLMNRIKNQEDFEGWRDLNSEVESKSGNFYDSKGVSKAFKKAIKYYKKELDKIDKQYKRGSPERAEAYRHFREAFDEKLAGIVLRDLGYVNTAKARKFILDNEVILYD